MYVNELIDSFKKSNGLSQDKDVAQALSLQPSMISKIRKGTRFLSDNDAVYMAQSCNIRAEIALMWCHADRNRDNERIQSIWLNMLRELKGN